MLFQYTPRISTLNIMLFLLMQTTSSPTQCSAATQLSPFVDAITVSRG
jgi:hypothetical protein